MSALFIPTLSHWLLGNRWSGSLGRASYYVTPRQRQEGEQTVDEVYAEAWTGPICYEQCTPERTAAFPVTEGAGTAADLAGGQPCPDRPGCPAGRMTGRIRRR